MWGFTKKIVKLGVVVLIVGGVATAILGRSRVRNAVYTLKDVACREVDGFVSEKRDLEREMRQLAEQYPKQIAELRSAVRDIQQQLEGTKQDAILCQTVIEECESDLGELQPKLDAASAAPVSYSTTVRVGGAVFTYEDALARSQKILDIRDSYRGRLEANSEATQVLGNELGVYQQELSKAENEYRDFLQRYRNLRQEIDRLEKTDQILDTVERRNEITKIDNSGRIQTLKAIENEIQRRKSEQQERMKAINTFSISDQYETRARMRNSQDDHETSVDHDGRLDLHSINH